MCSDWPAHRFGDDYLLSAPGVELAEGRGLAGALRCELAFTTDRRVSDLRYSSRARDDLRL